MKFPSPCINHQSWSSHSSNKTAISWVSRFIRLHINFSDTNARNPNPPQSVDILAKRIMMRKPNEKNVLPIPCKQASNHGSWIMDHGQRNSQPPQILTPSSHPAGPRNLVCAAATTATGLACRELLSVHAVPSSGLIMTMRGNAVITNMRRRGGRSSS